MDLTDLNKSENNITVDNSQISGKSSFLKSSKSLKDYELVNGSDIKIADLGKGAYGAVKLVKEKATNKFFALKIVIFFTLSGKNPFSFFGFLGE